MNIEIIKKNVDVSEILSDLHKNPKDWGAVKRESGAASLLDMGFPEVDVGVLQLVMGGVRSREEYVGDSELCIPTESVKNHPAVMRFLKKEFGKVSRCGFLSLPVGGKVGSHCDIGSYYQNKDRYHLSIQGKYKYNVGTESLIVEPGTLFRFNNKLEHSAENLGNNVRITFVFDINQEN
jgi:hypothetical protein